jgi:hypothetical protein
LAVRPRGDPPQPGPDSLLVKFQDGSRISDPGQVIAEFPQVVHASPRPDLLTRRKRDQRGAAGLLRYPGRQVRVREHDHGKEVAAGERPVAGPADTAAGAAGGVPGPAQVAQAVPELKRQLRLIEKPEPAEIIVGVPPLELADRLGQCPRASPYRRIAR